MKSAGTLLRTSPKSFLRKEDKPMTKQNRKILLIGLAILVGSFIVRSIVTAAMQVVNYQQRPARRIAKPSPAATEPSSAAPVQTLPGNLTGIWTGKTVLQGRG